MKDPELSDWKIQEYCSSSKEEEDEASLVKWMLTNGYVIGRKIAITGIVLPPIFLFSAIGVAVSVPFGFLYASYACTNKLMSFLLPIPPPSPLMLEYYNTDESVEFKEDIEDVNQGVDIVLEFDDIGSDDYRQKGQILMTNADAGEVDERKNDTEGEEKDDGNIEEVYENESNTVEVNEDGNLRDNARVDNTVEDDCVNNMDIGVVETTKPVTVKEIESEKVVEAGSENDEPVGEIHHVVILSGGNDENNYNSREVEEIDLVAREVKGDDNKDGSVESDEEVLRESMGTQEMNGDDASKNGSEDATMEEHLDLLHERDTNISSESLEVDNEAKENSADENVDVSARSLLNLAPLDTDNAKDAFITYKKLSSNKENLDDEKMWERIGAMRAIVGYKAPSQATCIGELKALYVFTGVEPPASFESDSDLDEVNDKLKFLMAIVGVK